MHRAYSPLAPRRGMTLTELMIVVAILVTLLAVMVPSLAVVIKGRDVRESARQLSTFLAEAQTRAVELGRPVGLWFDRDQNNPNASWQVYMAEVPPLYSGETYSSRARIEIPPQGLFFQAYISAVIDSQLQRSGFVASGDLIRFGHRGDWYEIYDGTLAGDDMVLRCIPRRPALLLPNAAGVQQFPPPTVNPTVHSGAGLAYEILRRPRRSGTRVLTLTTGTAIDLYWSGFDAPNEVAFRSAASASDGKQLELGLMFDATGRMHQVYLFGVANEPLAVEGDAYFLVGRIEQVPLLSGGQPVLPSSGLFNITDQSTLWVAVTQRGLIVTGENPGVVDATQLNLTDNVVYSRQLTKPGRSMGGGT